MKNFTFLILIVFLISCEDSNDKIEDIKDKSCFNMSVENAITGQEVVFTNCSGDVKFYLWDFGDGETSMKENPVHSYSNPGIYTVKLIVQNHEFKDVNMDMLIDYRDATIPYDISEKNISISEN